MLHVIRVETIDPYGFPLIVPSEMRHSVFTALPNTVGAEDKLPDVMLRVIRVEDFGYH